MNRKTLTCEYCKKENSTRLGRFCCSRKCQYARRTGMKHSQEWIENVRKGNKGKKRSLEIRLQMGLSRTGKYYGGGFKKGCSKPERAYRFIKGHISANKGKNTKIMNSCLVCSKEFLSYPRLKSKYCSHECAKDNLKGRKFPERSGENHFAYIKDRTLLKKSERKDKDVQYIYWARQIKNRDNWKCKINNSDCNGRLEAHHILNWVDYPELRYDVNNGITLCHAHHPRKWSEEKRLSPYFMDLILVSKGIL